MSLSRRLPSLAAVLLCLAACGAPPQPTGSVQFAASLQQALSASDVTRVKVTVSASDMTSLSVELAKSNGSWGGILGNVPAGSNRSFLAEAFDSSGAKRFQGQAAGISISANQTTAVALTLQEVAQPPPYANEAPVIDSAVASLTTVQTGGSLSLTSTSHDPNTGDTLSLAWTGSGGTFSAPSAANTSWTAPTSVGAQTLTFTVTDSQGAAVSVSLTVNVVSGVSTGNAALNISFNLFPLVSKVSASLNRLDAGQSTSVTAAASDADGDSLSYQWAATCPGTWTSATSSAASFVPSSIPAGSCNNCRLTVTVQDGHGGQTTGALNLCIAAASTPRFAPIFTNFYQAASSTAPGQTVAFDVTAMDPQSSSLTFAWTANTGSLAAAQNTASTSHVVWTAPSCASSALTPTVTATVTDAFGLSASQAFSVSGLPACAATWSSTAAMSAGRSLATATLLPSGQVLVTGDYTSKLASAEVYNPVTRSWSPAGTMATGRGQHTATLLNSGKVLIAGGYNGRIIASAELYDPATNSWASAGTMAGARATPTATLLNSGKVLIAGGGPTTAELYDPATNSWASAGTMASSQSTYPTASLLPSGKVLVVGGGTAAAELYDPATNSWTSAGTLSVSRTGPTSTLLPTGKVLVSGGASSSAYSSAELYDPATNSWAMAAPMAGARECHTATLLSSGKVLVTGGLTQTGPLASTELYDPATNSWASAGTLSVSRGFHTATLLNSGQVLITGGSTNGYGSIAISAAELYTP